MKRGNFIFVCFFALLSLLTARLFYIGIIQNKNLTEKVISQRTASVEFTSPRGIIYDRNMIRLTDAKMKLVVKDGKPYYVGNRTNNVLSHVIGYISPDGDGCGIEGAFDYVLSPEETSTISYLKDINNNKISDGYAIDVAKSYKGISLTVNYHIQKITEDAMDKFGIDGAVIVLDKNGEIVAMASRPDYDASNLADYLDGTEGELLNRAVLQYNPGSVFKIILLSAYLENHYNDKTMFECTGKIEIEGREFVCHKEEGHGLQTLGQAFANSCNCAFYEIGKTVGIGEIYRYAKDFGIGEEVLKINGIYEDSGFVPETVWNMQELANISIGQGDVMVTPLQMADVLCTLINGGVRKQLTLVNGLVDEKGKCMETSEAVLGTVVSESTARRTVEMLRMAVSDGTGSFAQLEECEAGGKTGSAETGWNKNGKIIQQGWFAGVFPIENPQYVCVVIAEDGTSGSLSACPVFKYIGDSMVQAGYVNISEN